MSSKTKHHLTAEALFVEPTITSPWALDKEDRLIHLASKFIEFHHH